MLVSKTRGKKNASEITQRIDDDMICINSNPLSLSNIPTLSIVTLLYGQAEIRLLSGAGRGRPRSDLNGLLTDLIFNT